MFEQILKSILSLSWGEGLNVEGGGDYLQLKKKEEFSYWKTPVGLSDEINDLTFDAGW